MGPKQKQTDYADRLKELEDNLLIKFEKLLDKKISLIQQQIDRVADAVEEATLIASEALNCTRENKEKIYQLDLIYTKNSNKLDKLEKKCKELEDQLDDQTNRNMRTTLVFKGIAGQEKSWNETVNLLSEQISTMAEDKNITKAAVSMWIERGHRASKKDGSNIIAKFLSWQHSERVKSILIKYNIESKRNGNLRTPPIYVEQLLSQKTMVRMNAAKMKRKEMKAEHPDWKLHVVFPAKLMCKKPDDERYSIVSEF